MNPPPPPTEPAGEPPSVQALREQYEAGATVQELVDASGLPYGTLLNRLHDAGTVMRTSWQTRRLREDPQARARLAARVRQAPGRRAPVRGRVPRRSGRCPDRGCHRLSNAGRTSAEVPLTPRRYWGLLAARSLRTAFDRRPAQIGRVEVLRCGARFSAREWTRLR